MSVMQKNSSQRFLRTTHKKMFRERAKVIVERSKLDYERGIDFTTRELRDAYEKGFNEGVVRGKELAKVLRPYPQESKVSNNRV